jgi:hypothetical protein
MRSINLGIYGIAAIHKTSFVLLSCRWTVSMRETEGAEPLPNPTRFRISNREHASSFSVEICIALKRVAVYAGVADAERHRCDIDGGGGVVPKGGVRLYLR